ncbi:Eukaryotic-type low-affinity urea transporter [Labilithrix luteola]|uniref:Eukaryotic-type low-affinity urea transporter n=1 Tax=Labilithrix luteola TaxID=1391654 RepID=A0A0K1Q3K6_9BACT|nr:urea transporter [Labilithrix luteola]AKV00318.1 Eukaryotic-type low-affinity urea transporter [Labilithrix luteola]
MTAEPTRHLPFADNAAVRFVDTCLRGASQVFFQNNPITGLFLLAGIFWGSATAGTIPVAIGAVLGVMVGTLAAMLLGSDETALRKGMFGFNPILVGIAVPTFLGGQHPLVWLYLVIGAAAAHVVMLAASRALERYGVAASTGPFVITTWILMLAASSFAQVSPVSLAMPVLPHAIDGAVAHATITPLFLLQALFRNISQVFLVNNAIAGLLFVIGIAASSIRAALFAVVGSAVAMAIALLFGADAHAIANGLYGFSPVLTAIGVGCVFLRPSWKVTLYALFATVVTVIVQGGMNILVEPFGIPTLTMPFVLTMWLFTFPKMDLQPRSPHDNAAMDDGQAALST